MELSFEQNSELNIKVNNSEHGVTPADAQGQSVTMQPCFLYKSVVLHKSVWLSRSEIVPGLLRETIPEEAIMKKVHVGHLVLWPICMNAPAKGPLRWAKMSQWEIGGELLLDVWGSNAKKDFLCDSYWIDWSLAWKPVESLQNKCNTHAPLAPCNSWAGAFFTNWSFWDVFEVISMSSALYYSWMLPWHWCSWWGWEFWENCSERLVTS